MERPGHKWGVSWLEYGQKLEDYVNYLEAKIEKLENFIDRFQCWTRPTAQDWENGAVRNDFDAMQKEGRGLLEEK